MRPFNRERFLLYMLGAIFAFQALSSADRMQLVSYYMTQTGMMDDVSFIDRSPASADPLWIVHGRKNTQV